MLLNLTGCGLFGAFYGVFIDPLIPRAPVPAEHDMSEKQILIWVDYQAALDQNHMLRRELTEQLREELEKNRAVASAVDYQQITQYRMLHPESAQMTIRQLGREFAADEVLYVLVDNFKLAHEAGPGYYKPTVTGYLKVIEVNSGKRLWPTNQTQRPFILDTGFSETKDTLQEQRLIRELCQQAAQKLALYFYEHRTPREGT